MKFEELKKAVESGHEASAILLGVLQELADKHYCPEAAGFEGSETFSDCGECACCLAKKIIGDEYDQF